MVVSLLSLLTVALVLGKRSPTTEHRLFEPDFTRIRCPLCDWRPARSDRWYCEPGCSHRWNTFETAGVCPRCGKQWEETACLKCAGWSPHGEWYERTARDDRATTRYH